MNKKTKFYTIFGSILIAVIVILTSGVIVLASRVATITTELSVIYTAKEISGSFTASYTLNNITTLMTTSSGAQKIILTGTEDISPSETLSPPTQIILTKQVDFVIFCYSFTNTGSAKYWADVSYTDTGDTDKNYNITYSKDGTTYTTTNSGIRVDGITDEQTEIGPVSYYIKVEGDNFLRDTILTGNFNWILTTEKSDETKKTNDLSLASKMNNIITTYNATNEINSLTDALYAIISAGISSVKTEVDGTKFMFDKQNMKILYIDLDFNVLNFDGYDSSNSDQWLELKYSGSKITDNSSDYDELFA